MDLFVTKLLTLALSIVLLGVSIWMIHDGFTAHQNRRRYYRANQLLKQIMQMVEDDQLTPQEGAHLTMILQEPTPAAITLVEERLEDPISS